MHDAMRMPAQRINGAIGEGFGLRQMIGTRGDPAAQCFCPNSFASFRLPRGGMVSTISRVAARMRSV